MDTTIRASLLFLCFVVLTWSLHITANILTPIALAIFIWLIIDAFASWIDNLSPKLPYWLALTIAVLIIVCGMVGIVFIITDTVGDIAREAPRYQARIGELFSGIEKLTPIDNLSYSALDEQIGITAKLQAGLLGFAGSMQGVLSNFMLIALYVIFLFVAQSNFPKQIEHMFQGDDIATKAKRDTVKRIGHRIRYSIETYLGVQTVISLIQTVLSYIIMVALGLDNALFWALVIFVFNYIPIIGGIAATFLPALFALVQFDSTGKVVLLIALLFGIQTIISNTVQPKMMGDSMNLSALVVVLSLTLWGALWGGVGAFLSAPLTVIIMIILAQFQTTRWIAVLLSADGQPDLEPEEKKKAAAVPSL